MWVWSARPLGPHPSGNWPSQLSLAHDIRANSSMRVVTGRAISSLLSGAGKEEQVSHGGAGPVLLSCPGRGKASSPKASKG